MDRKLRGGLLDTEILANGENGAKISPPQDREEMSYGDLSRAEGLSQDVPAASCSVESYCRSLFEGPAITVEHLDEGIRAGAAVADAGEDRAVTHILDANRGSHQGIARIDAALQRDGQPHAVGYCANGDAFAARSVGRVRHEERKHQQERQECRSIHRFPPSQYRGSMCLTPSTDVL
jgi:hypothetical protein